MMRGLVMLAALPLLRPGSFALPQGFVDEGVARVKRATGFNFVPSPKPMLLTTSKDGLLFLFPDLSESPPRKRLILNVTNRVCDNGERGLTTVLAHPDFQRNHYIYIYYTYKKFGNCRESTVDGPVNRVARYTMKTDNLELDESTQLILMETTPLRKRYHNGGDMAFGNDGFLYITIGDGGQDVAGDMGDLKGSVIRLTENGDIPPDNPFASVRHSSRCNEWGRPSSSSQADICQEIYAFGFRNPFRFAIDSLSDRIFVNDVGEDTFEEVNELVPGGNFGWPKREGPCEAGKNIPSLQRDSVRNCFEPTLLYEQPVYWLAHPRDIKSAIVGGAFVPSGIWPIEYDNSYIFADFGSGKFHALSENATLTCQSCRPPIPGWNRTLFHEWPRPVQLTFGPFKDTFALYYTTRRAHNNIRRIYYRGEGNRSPAAVIETFLASDGNGLTVHFDGTGSNDPDGDTLEYVWDFGDNGKGSTESAPTYHYLRPGKFIVHLSVSDGQGGLSSTTTEIDVENRQDPPILFPWVSGGNCPVGYDFCGMLEFCKAGTTFAYRLPCRGECSCPNDPGPLIRLEPGKKYRMTLRNAASELSEPTNVHTHGLHIIGDGDGDDVTRVVSGGSCLDYTWDILPNHPGGTYWYHAHHHGYTETQVGGGAFGMLIVEENKRINRDTPEWASNELILLVSRIKGNVFGNGKHYDIFHVHANQWYRLRVSIVDPVGEPDFLTFTRGCTVHKVASDGIWHSVVPGPIGSRFEMTGASRGDFAFKCSSSNSFVNIRYRNVIVAIVHVGSVEPNPFEMFPWRPTRPSSLSNIATAPVPPANKFNLTIQRESINGVQWDPYVPLTTIAYDEVHEWTIFGSLAHPFHIHLYHIMIVTPGGCGAHREGEFYDTIASPVPCTIRFKTADFGQRLVLHCHVLSHEDNGAMSWVEVAGSGLVRNDVKSPPRSCLPFNVFFAAP